MTIARILEALRAADVDALAAARPFDADVGPAIEAVLDDLGDGGRHLATCVLGESASVSSAATLLTMTGDPSESIAVAAADALLGLDAALLPDAKLLVSAAAVRLSPSVRERLYRLIGQQGNRAVLARLRGLYDQERIPSARRKLELAAARLGGQEERRALIDRVEQVRLGLAREVFEEVVLSNDRGALRAMLPWLDDARVAVVVGSHASTFEIRMRDLAVIAADRQGLAFEHDAPLPLRRVDAALLPLVRRAMEAIPTTAPRGSAGEPPGAAAPTPGSPAQQPSYVRHSPPAVAAPPLAPPPTPPAPVGPLIVPRIPQPMTVDLTPHLTTKPATLQNQTMELPPNLVVADAAPYPIRKAAGKPPTRTEAAIAAGAPSELGYERYTWACASFAVHPQHKAEILREIGLPDDRAWAHVHARWQTWLGADRARLGQWLEYVARLRQKLQTQAR